VAFVCTYPVGRNSVHSLFVSRFNRTVAAWAVESGNRSRGKTAKRTGSGSPASLLSGGSGRLTRLVAGCVLLEHAEDTSRIARSAQGRSSALLHNAKGVFEMRLRDTIRRAAEPGIGDLACRRPQRILSSAALAAGLPNRDIGDRNWKTYRMERDCATGILSYTTVRPQVHCKDLTTARVPSHAQCTPLPPAN
jgi:hypothetical protein